MLDAARFTVPYPEHTHFVGREEDLRRLLAALQGEGPVGINPAAMGNPTGVTGQGGIGKTQLAVAYAYQYQEHYPDGVYWLNAAEGLWSAFAGLGRHFLEQGDSQALKARLWETLRSRFSIEEIRDLCLELGVNYEEFSPQLGISSLTRELIQHIDRRGQLPVLEAAVRRLRGELAETQAQDELVIHAFTWLRDRPRSLLILDNIADPTTLDKPLARDCVPGRLPSRVLFTTRRRELGHFRPVELKTLPPDAALELLLRDHHRQPVLDPSHSEHETARDICAVFGYLPLALEIAAAHLAKFHTAPLTIYRTELRRRGALDVIADERIATDTRHEAGLAAALEAQWATLGNEAQMLLRVAGQLSEAAYVPVARLGLLAGVPEEGESFFDVTLPVALAELQDASLVEELAGDQLRLHPLVREFARDRTPLEENTAFRVQCVQRLLAAISDIKTLERQCNSRGIDALIYDLLAGRNLLVGTTYSEGLRDLRAYLRVLRLEVHNLRGWRQDDAPSFLAQQLHNRLALNEMPALFGDLSGYLRLLRSAWLARWTHRGQSSELELTLVEDRSLIEVVAVTPDGRQAISGGEGGILRVWDLDTGAIQRTLAEYDNRVQAVVITPDGRQAISGGRDSIIYVWNLNSGTIERTLTGHKDWILAVAITSDGQRLITGGRDGILRIWDLDRGTVERTLEGHIGWVRTVAVTQDGKRAVSGGGDGLRVWNLETGATEQVLNSQNGIVLGVALTPDGRQIISGGEHGLCVWDLNTGKTKWVLDGHVGWVRAVAMTPDGLRVVSAGEDWTLRIWNLGTGESERVLTGHAGKVVALAITPDGQRAVSSGHDQTLRVWDLHADNPAYTFSRRDDRVRTIAVTQDGRRAIMGGKDSVRIWDLGTGHTGPVLSGHKGTVLAVAVTPDGERAITSGQDQTVCIWNLDKGTIESVLTGHEGWVFALAVTPDGQRAVSGGLDEALRVWNLETGMTERLLTGHADWVRAVAMMPDGKQVISGVDDGTLRIWNLDAGTIEYTLSGHEGWIWAVTVTQDGRLALSGGEDGMLRLWNLDTRKVRHAIMGHFGGVYTFALTPDEQLAVSGGYDRAVRLWSLDKGQELPSASFDAAIVCLAVASGSPLTIVAGDAAGGVYCLEWVE